MSADGVLSRQTTEQLRLHESAVAEPAGVRTLADAERAHITSILHETNWVVGGPHGAAAQLGMPRTTLIARMHRLGISAGGFARPERSAYRFVKPITELPSGLTDDSAAGLQAMGAVAG